MRRRVRVAVGLVMMLTALLFSERAAFADSLSGRILDPQGHVIADVRLQLFDLTSGHLREAVSGPRGGYTFKDVPAGDYLLEAQGTDGSLSGSSHATVDGDSVLVLSLSLSALSVEVLVTASSTPLSVRDVGKATDVIDSEEIALRNEMSVAEAVRTVPGLRVRTLRGPGSLTTIQTRGLRNQDTAVLIDGMRFRDAAGLQGDATSLLQSMPTVDADRIEVMRGSGSSLYGSNAMAGVINIVSRTGSGRPQGDVLVEGGGLGLVRTVPRFRGGVADDRFTYSGALSYVNMTRGIREAQTYRSVSPQGSARYQISPSLSVTGRLWYANDELQTNESPTFTPDVLANFPANGPVSARALPTDQLELFEQGLPFDPGTATFIPDQHDPDQLRALSFLNGSATVRHVVSRNTSYRVSYQGVDTSRELVDGPLGGGIFEPLDKNISQFDGHIDTVHARLDTAAGSWNLISAGYEFEREHYLDANTGDVGSIDIDSNSQSFFAQNQLQFLDGQLQVAVGGRLQMFDPKQPLFTGGNNPYEGLPFDTPTAYTGDVSAAYFIEGSTTKVRFHAGNSYRAPALYERFGGSYSSFSSSYSYSGDPRLRPERAVAIDGGVDQWLFDSSAQVSATAFYTDLRETIIFDFANFPRDDPFGRFGGYRNSEGGTAKGVELSLRASPAAKTNLQVSYTFTDSTSQTPTIGDDFFGVLGLSRHMFTVMASHWVTPQLNVTFDMFAASEYSVSPFGALGRQILFTGPVKADIVVRYDLPLSSGPSVDVFLKANNMFSQRPYENGFLGPSVWATGGLRIRY